MSAAPTDVTVIRPVAVLPESAARLVLVELAHGDARAGGCWASTPTVWERYDRPWNGPGGDEPGDAALLGRIDVGYGVPTRYAVSLYRGSVTPLAREHGWTVERLCDDVLAFAGYTLARCPRADLAPRVRLAG